MQGLKFGKFVVGENVNIHLIDAAASFNEKSLSSLNIITESGKNKAKAVRSNPQINQNFRPLPGFEIKAPSNFSILCIWI